MGRGMSLDTSLEVADRVVGRVQSGVVPFRAMNATEEYHVIAALRYYRDIALKAAEVAAENIRMAEELDAYRKRAADGINI
jgi:hypothetical protein